MIKVLAVGAFLSGLLLWVRVMFFGVRRQVDEHVLDHRKWPLALAALLIVAGAMLYPRADDMTAAWALTTAVASLAAAAGAWALVVKSAAIPSTDPEDDPRYRFQGHVARVVAPITTAKGTPGRIVLEFDGKRYEFGAQWSPEADLAGGQLATAAIDSEVVIEYVDGEMAFVEPWVVVEKRL